MVLSAPLLSSTVISALFSSRQKRPSTHSIGFLLILLIFALSLNVNLSECLRLNNENEIGDNVNKFISELPSSNLVNTAILSGSDEGSFFFAKSRQLRESMRDLFHGMVRKRRELASRTDFNKEGFTNIEKDAMLLLHNSLRSQVTPTAANMIELTWDNDIEAFTQDWANNCTGDHRPNRNLNSWVNMGENLYWRGGGSFNEKLATDYWWTREVVHYTLDTNTCVAGEVCGHYVTAAWAKSAKMGCGIKRCATLPDAGIDRPTYYFVCNYNDRFLSNTRPYVQGTSCSSCPAEFPKCRYNLCVTQSMLDNCEGYNGTTEWIGVQRPTTVTDPSMNCTGFATQGPPTTNQGTTVNGNNNSSNNTTGDTDDSGQSLSTSLLLFFFSIVLAIAVNSPSI